MRSKYSCIALGIVIGGMVLLGYVIVIQGHRDDIERHRASQVDNSIPQANGPLPANPTIDTSQESKDTRASYTQPSLSRDRADRILGVLAKKYRVAFSSRPFPSSSLEANAILYLREARLLASCFPGVIEEVALPIASDRMKEDDIRAYMIYILGHIAIKGGANASNAIYILINDPNQKVSGAALAANAMIDPEGMNRGLYLSKCREWDVLAYGIVSRWVDQSTVTTMKDIIASIPDNAENPQATCRLKAKEVLRRIDILVSPRVEDSLAEILKRVDGADMSLFQWALWQAGRRGGNYFKGILEDRLRAGYAKAEKEFVVEGEYSRNEGPKRPKRDIKHEYINSSDFIRHTGDEMYDDVLLSYWKMGGALDDLQRGRLRNFGYACDPLERLLELIPEIR